MGRFKKIKKHLTTCSGRGIMNDRQKRIAHAKQLAKEVKSWSNRKLYVTYSQLKTKTVCRLN